MRVNQTIREQFLTKTDETGRFTVYSTRTGRTYYVEPHGDPHVEWGSVDPVSGKMCTKKGWKKSKGSIEPDASLITKDNGFKNIKTLKAGESPLAYIERIDSGYPSI